MWGFYSFVIIFLTLLLTNVAVAFDRVVQGMEPNSITIIGEKHKRPESVHFFKSLITDYLQQNKCLTVALEIASNQQSFIDEIKQGRPVSDIEIAPMIDHPPFRQLINDLAQMQGSNDCLKIIAIDAGIKSETRRDEWMATKLAEHVGQAPILALVGNLHTLKKVEWNYAMSKKEPYVAEILVSQGKNVRTYPQIWLDRECSTRDRYIHADSPEATEMLNDNLFSLLNADKPKTANGVVNGIVMWECDR
ncbi:hypothetical protein [Nitrosomonas communis]|uniref:Haem-binding uptake Tiki superfamily ChaN domain-containing protein n=1 Tax=Nitrosomonas communis TaxID=44574 RepID=A0A1I4QVB3_9PROT|nr:hypothetical protein [Nitrosomonas communis]SFM43650.1 hypothetical protein SAMN05421863_102854 [Nitrosomonas communis]